MKLSKYEYLALEYLSQCGRGFTAGTIARNCGWTSRSQMAIFRYATILPLVKAGLLDLLDANKPAAFVITDAGRSALSSLPDTESWR